MNESLNELLADIKARLLKGEYKNEEHVRLSLVARVLQGLGWNIWNPIEVNTEFVVVPNEDSKKVDAALFLRPFGVPTVFVEIKAVGQMQGKLTATELQMRNYNRDNQAMFTVITDGRNWRFYLSSAGGEFSRRCFKTFDMLDDDLEEVEASLSAFLKKSEIENARQKAEDYLKLNQIQRTAADCLPEARRKISEPPYPSLPAALVSLVGEKGFSITQDDAVKFIKEEAGEGKPPVPIAFPPPQTPTPYKTNTGVKIKMAAPQERKDTAAISSVPHKELLNRRIENLLKAISSDESRVKPYRRGLSYYIQTDYPEIERIGLGSNLEGDEIILGLCFGDSQRQASALYKSNPNIGHLHNTKWRVSPNFHVSFKDSNLVRFESEASEHYLQFWKDNVEKIHQQKRGGVKEYFEWLVDNNVVKMTKDAKEQLDEKFYNTKRQTLNICPGFAIDFTFNISEEEELDKSDKLKFILAEKIKEGLKVVGHDGHEFLKNF